MTLFDWAIGVVVIIIWFSFCLDRLERAREKAIRERLNAAFKKGKNNGRKRKKQQRD